MTPADELSCRELVELVTEYFDGALPEDDRTRFEQHLEACPYCRTYLDQMRRTIHRLNTLQEESIEPGVREELIRAFRGWSAGR